MQPRFDFGAPVRVLRNLRNDGTFPGMKTGDLLVRRGSVGFVRDVGVFLQDQVIYSVHFMDDDRVVGCREEELQPEDAPWTPSLFETRDKVQTTASLVIGGEVVAPTGDRGEVLKVLRDDPERIAYHVLFGGRVLQVPESVLEDAEPA